MDTRVRYYVQEQHSYSLILEIFAYYINILVVAVDLIDGNSRAYYTRAIFMQSFL